MKATYYSNIIENLYERLKENLFFNPSKFKTYVFLPNKILKNWLMKKFCDDPFLEIAFNINFINIDNFFKFFIEKFLQNEKKYLKNFELSLIIRKKIIQFLDSKDKNFIELDKYLKKNGKISPKRLLKICDELTQSFLKYSIYGNFFELKEKIKTNWQAKLFYEIFYKNNTFLVYRDLQRINVKNFNKSSFHFFAIDYVSDIYFDFINKFLNVFHYVISPSQIFYEDYLSTYERHYLKKHLVNKNISLPKINKLDEYIKEQNNFFANMIKLKRNYLKIINSYDNYHSFESYVDLLDIKNPTLLNLFQRDILYLENREQKINLDKEDKSVQVHTASSKLREIEVLYSNIINLMIENPDIKPADISVIAPNVDKYVQHIHMIFSSQKKVDYKILNIKLVKESKLFSGLKLLFSLTENNWDKSDILNLIDNPLIQKKYQFTQEEIELLFRWIDKANINWGLNESHVFKKIQSNKYIKNLNKKTWYSGFSRIFLGLIFVLNDSEIDLKFDLDVPLEYIDMSSASIVDKFLKLLTNLYNDLKIIEEKMCLSLDKWHQYLTKIFHDYFQIDSSYIEQISLKAYLNFLKDLKGAKKHLKENKFSFDVIFNYFESYFKNKKFHFNLNDLQAVTFSSFEISSLSTKAVFIIGLQENSLNFNENQCLDLAKDKKVPLKSDKLRSLFLEALLSARKYLILSFISCNQKKEDSSILIQEFLSYLDKNYSILQQKPSKYCLFTHPSFSFHESYFSLKKFSKEEDYLSAKAFYKLETKIKKRCREDIVEIPEIIDIKDLKLLCSNPIKFYLNKSLKIFLKETKASNEFNFSFLDRYLIRKDSLKKEVKNILFLYENRAKIPFGIFGSIERNKIQNEIKNYHETLKRLDIDKKEIINIEFSQNLENINEKIIKRNPIEVCIENKIVKIIGRLEAVSRKGILFHTEDKISNLLKVWPEILIFFTLEKDFSKQIIFTKQEKIRKFNIEKVDLYLSKYIEYYLQCLKTPSFMLTNSSEYILKADVINLSKVIKNYYEGKQKILDIYTKWFFVNFPKLKAKTIINDWTELVQNTFKPILEGL